MVLDSKTDFPMNNLRISTKLWSVILALLAAMLLIAGLVVSGVSAIADRNAESMEISQSLVNKALMWRGMTESLASRSMAAVTSKDPAVAILFKDSLTNGAGEIKLLREDIAQLAKTNADLAMFEKIGSQAKTLRDIDGNVRQLQRAGDAAAAVAAVQSQYVPATRTYLSLIDGFVQLQQRKVEMSRSAALHERQGTLFFGCAGGLLVIGLAVLAALALIRSIRRPLDASVRLANAIASGDLTQVSAVTRRDEFGQLMTSLQHMNSSLGRMVTDVRNSTEEISTASSQIAAGNHDLSARTEKTAASLQQTSASMQQLSDVVANNAASAQLADQLAQSASAAATLGGSVVGKVVHTMQSISEASLRIADIIGVIDGIAFQTNILALNAAVEAARAGEQGRGFAVVASEVRSLAQRSAEAAKEIKSVIGTSNVAVCSGTMLVADARSSMAEIVISVKRVSDIINEIRASTSEQSAGILQVNEAVGRLDQATQQNAALVEEAAAAASAMQNQTSQVCTLMGRFQIPV